MVAVVAVEPRLFGERAGLVATATRPVHLPLVAPTALAVVVLAVTAEARRPAVMVRPAMCC